MNVTVREFILTNNNPFIYWKIDGDFWGSKENIPEYLLDRYVFDWVVDLWNASIKITTEYHT